MIIPSDVLTFLTAAFKLVNCGLGLITVVLIYGVAPVCMIIPSDVLTFLTAAFRDVIRSQKYGD